MRKLGFTLAEVLITLGIIGVIATLTLPTLMSNTAEREYSTALKKAISSLTESVQMQVALENVSFDEMYDASNMEAGDNEDSDFSTEATSLYAFLSSRMQTEKYAPMDGDKVCAENASSGTANCLNYNTSAKSFDSAIFFRDGSAIMYNGGDAIDTNKDCYDTKGEQINCFKVLYDVNGTKKPNAVANCDGQAGKAKDISGDLFDLKYDEDGNTTSDVVCNKDTFNARDQYPLYLYGIGAYPGSKASKYLYDKK